LAGVRNYSDVLPISETKGLPLDSEWLNTPHEYAYRTNPMSGEIIPYEEMETNRHFCLGNPNYHSFSWLSLKELLDFDYSQQFENRRYRKTIITAGGGTVVDGGAKAAPGEGEMVSYRNFLGTSFFECLLQLKMLGAPEDVRIVFWFDN